MKIWPAFAVLLVLGGVPAHADDKDEATSLRREIEAMKFGRDINKTLLREALLQVGRRAMKQITDPPPNTDEARKRTEQEFVAWRAFLHEKEKAVVERTDQLERKTTELSALVKEKSAAIRRETRANQIAQREGLIEKME